MITPIIENKTQTVSGIFRYCNGILKDGEKAKDIQEYHPLSSIGVQSQYLLPLRCC